MLTSDTSLGIWKILYVSLNMGLLSDDQILLCHFLLLSHVLLERKVQWDLKCASYRRCSHVKYDCGCKERATQMRFTLRYCSTRLGGLGNLKSWGYPAGQAPWQSSCDLESEGGIPFSSGTSAFSLQAFRPATRWRRLTHILGDQLLCSKSSFFFLI